MTTPPAQTSQILERILTMELVRVTERAAVSAARLRGRGNEKGADQAAVDAMRRELNVLPIRGTVRIGEGEHTFTRLTEPTAIQAKAFELLGVKLGA